MTMASTPAAKGETHAPAHAATNAAAAKGALDGAAADAAGNSPRRWVGCPVCGMACRWAGASAAWAPAGSPVPRCPRCEEPLAELQAVRSHAAFSAQRRAADVSPEAGARPYGWPDPAATGPLGSQRSWALLLASVVAYVPANLLPVMSTTSALVTETHTLLGGIAELWAAGNWVLAVIVFIASVAVPLLKIGALALLVWSADHATAWRRHERSRLYRLVDAVGHWSMLDVYVVVLLTAMVRFGSIANVEPQPGLLAFAAMVVLTLVAAHSVDPKRIWAGAATVDDAGAASREAATAPTEPAATAFGPATAGVAGVTR